MCVCFVYINPIYFADPKLWRIDNGSDLYILPSQWAEHFFSYNRVISVRLDFNGIFQKFIVLASTGAGVYISELSIFRLENLYMSWSVCIDLTTASINSHFYNNSPTYNTI